MRNFTLLRNVAFIFTLFVGLNSNAQTRVSLIEQVSSASCGPCAFANPGFNDLLSNYGKNIAVIKYQRGGGSYIDPMYEFNSTDANGRVPTFYGVGSFPQSWINGEFMGSPLNVTSSDIDNANNVPAGYDIQISKSLNASMDNLHIEVTFTATQDFSSGDYWLNKAFIVVVEKKINYSSPPGTNGEEEFENVMRKILPSYNGNLIGSVANGSTNSYSFDYAIDVSEIDPNQLEVVAFVQNASSKEVFQAATTSVPTGIKEFELNGISNFNIFPNPASYEVSLNFNIENDSQISIEVINLLGETVVRIDAEKYAKGEYVEKLDISDLTNGIYFATIRTNNNVISKKFIVSK